MTLCYRATHQNFASPAIGLLPVFLIFTQYYGKGRIHIYKQFYLPEALPIVIFGIAAGWIYGLNDTVGESVTPGLWAGGAFIEGFADIGDYMGVVLPFSIAASFTVIANSCYIMCRVCSGKGNNPSDKLDSVRAVCRI